LRARRWASFVGPLRAKLWRADGSAGPAGRARFAHISENQLAAAPPFLHSSARNRRSCLSASTGRR
jgi:hypothetical protein